MNVDEQVNISTLKCLPNHFLHTDYLWGRLLHWVHPLAVEVETCETAAVVPDDDSIRVQHRHNLEYECVTEDARFSFIAQHHIYDSFHDEGTV